MAAVCGENQLWNLSHALSYFRFVGALHRIGEFSTIQSAGKKSPGVRRPNFTSDPSRDDFVALV
jgi:hypothetical protein